MSYYHIEGNGGFKNLPERILVREDGYLGAYKFYGEPIVDYWYVPEAENAKLREALRAAWKCAHAGISCSDCRMIAGGCTLQSAMCELGIEVE